MIWILYFVVGFALSFMWTALISDTTWDSLTQFILAIVAVFIFWPLIAARYLLLGLILGPVVFNGKSK
jgi:hypothetical protein